MDEQLGLVLIALLSGGSVVALINAIAQRRRVGSEAAKNGADVTSVVIAAARELVDPLRQELAAERAEHEKEMTVLRKRHARDIAQEHEKVNRFRESMDEALREAHALRGELALARVEADELRRDREAYREKVRLRDLRIATLEKDKP